MESNRISKCLLGAFFLAQSSAGLAVPVTFSVEGIVNSADPTNAFNLDLGDPVFVTGMFDDDAVAPLDFSVVSFGAGTGNMMDFFLGDVTLNQTNDVDFADGDFPQLLFFDGVFQGFNYLAVLGFNDSPVDFETVLDDFTGIDAFANVVEGVFDLDSFEATPKAVPEPSTLALMAIGLAGAGFAGRRKLAA